jgi:hypothetical protein
MNTEAIGYGGTRRAMLLNTQIGKIRGLSRGGGSKVSAPAVTNR